MILLGRFDLTKSLMALAIVVASMGWGFPVGGMALGVYLAQRKGWWKVEADWLRGLGWLDGL